MNFRGRVNVRESVGGNRRDADDTNGNNTERTETMGTIETEFLAEADVREREHQRQLRGDFSVTPTTQATDGGGETIFVSARDAFYAREAEMSRRPPSGRIFSRESAGDAASIDDDDDSVSAPSGLSARDAYLQRETERSRLPARGSR